MITCDDPGTRMGVIEDFPIKGQSAPPPAPSARQRSDAELRRRARKALRLIEQGMFVTDQTGYRSRNTAKATARRLIDVISRFEEVPREHLQQYTRLRPDGWHWWIVRKDN